MSRVRAVLFFALFTLLLPLLFMHFVRLQAAVVPSDASMTTGAKNIGVVADTTATMGPELSAFSSAWQDADFDHTQAANNAPAEIAPTVPMTHCDPFCPPLTATFRLVTFKDIAQNTGGTTSYNTFGQQLSNLSAEGGEGCADNALGGLLTMAQNLPTSRFLASDVALLTDATPTGNRSNYMFVISRMLRRGVNVHALISGWCSGAPVPEAALEFLAQATGGQYYRPLIAGDYYTESLMVQDKLFATDMLLSQDGNVSGGTPDTIPLQVDSSINGVSVEMNYTGCLTCPLASLAQPLNATAAPPVQIELRDPDNNVIDTATVGFDELTSSRRHFLRFYPPSASDLKDGEWEIRISGDGDYNVTVMSQSSVHMTYLGPGSIPVSQPSSIRVALAETAAGVLAPEMPTDAASLVVDFQLVPSDGVGTPQSISLFDDGEHNDGAAGDGIYGGMVQPTAPGWWRIAAEGQLDDGTSFRRLAEVPIRVQQYRVTKPDADTAAAGTTRQVTFTLSNDATTANGIGTNSGAVATATTFDLALFSEQGWTMTNTIPVSVTLAPGETFTITADVVIPAAAPEGTVEESTFVAVDANDVNVGLTAVAETEVADEKVYLPFVIKP